MSGKRELEKKYGVKMVLLGLGVFVDQSTFFSWTDLTDNILRVGVPQSIIVEGGDMGKKRVQVQVGFKFQFFFLGEKGLNIVSLKAENWLPLS